MVVKEIEFGDFPPSPAFVQRALEVLGLEFKSSVRGPLRRNDRAARPVLRTLDSRSMHVQSSSGGAPLWTPNEARAESSRLADYMRWLNAQRRARS